jgi:effector protein DrrA/SidM
LPLTLHYKFASLGGEQRKHNYEVTANHPTATEDFKARYDNMVGDQLKTEILIQFKSKIDQCTNKAQITEAVKEFKNSDEFKILATAQGSFTRAAHKLGLQSIIKTDSVKAVDKIFKEAINNMSNKKDDTPQGPSSGPG